MSAGATIFESFLIHACRIPWIAVRPEWTNKEKILFVHSGRMFICNSRIVTVFSFDVRKVGRRQL